VKKGGDVWNDERFFQFPVAFQTWQRYLAFSLFSLSAAANGSENMDDYGSGKAMDWEGWETPSGGK